MSVVLDSSLTLAWLFEDERTDAAMAVLQQVTDTGAIVPALWRLEVANALQMAVRRGRIDASFRDASLTDLGKLDILIDTETERHAWTTTLQLAQRLQLTVYDAAYLELAQRCALPLATLDELLRAAAAAIGVDLMGAPD